MRDFFVISQVYPSTGAVQFLFWMLVVIAIAIWVGVREK
jgi:hypothetical protein